MWHRRNFYNNKFPGLDSMPVVLILVESLGESESVKGASIGPGNTKIVNLLRRCFAL